MYFEVHPLSVSSFAIRTQELCEALCGSVESQSVHQLEHLLEFAVSAPWPSSPLQYSCLRNPINRGDWQATVHEVTKVGHD